MKKRLLFAPLVLLVLVALGADSPVVPADSIARKKELLFSDDFERPELGPAWGQVVPTFTLETQSQGQCGAALAEFAILQQGSRASK